ncbi:serine/threonine protein kinase [Mariniblastus fucicola]|uniref:Serine/threonine-protein kinase PrkC n=1 Tax=Mariniblastus fucicola TaxID=980251 RepID=A0A5B9P9K8_9BACT|nr:serine/threonine-protein kinase [Mariniblastus fucicola]QEG22139.1 Serine/threonine-protein kinase PrkC [Mariniblastus fucicola]
MSPIDESDPGEEASLASLLQKLCELEDSGDDKSVIEKQLEGLSESELAELFGAGQCMNLLNQLKESDSEKISRVLVETARSQETAPDNPARSHANIPDQIGRYEIVRLAAQGGFANVYQARDVNLQRSVALKVPLVERLGDQNAIERFQREARAVAMLSHPGVVPVYEAGGADGQPFIAFKWIEGCSLHSFLKTRKQPLPAKEVASALKRIADAVAHAHAKGILHRDIKPANVLIEGSGEKGSTPWNESVCVTDFGLAKHFADVEASEFNTVDGSILGTPAYMSPEQVRSESEIGPPSDVYSLGTVLYEMLVGKTPHRKTGYSGTIRAIETETPVPIASFRKDVPADLIAICEKCLRKDAADRYPSAFELAGDLGRFLDGIPVQAKPRSPFYLLTRWAKRNPVVAFSLGLAFAGLTIGLTAMAWSNAEISAARDDSQRQVEVLESIFNDLDYNLDGDVLSEPDLRDRLAIRLIDSVDLIAESADPESASRLMGTLGRTLATLGHPEESREVVEQAIKIGGDRLTSDQKDRLQVRLAAAVMAQGKFDESAASLGASIERIIESPTQETQTKADALIYFAESQFQLSKLAKETIVDAKNGFERLENWLPESGLPDRYKQRYVSYAKFRVACCNYSSAMNDGNFELLNDAFDNYIKIYGSEHSSSISAAYAMAAKLRQRGKFKDALSLSEQTLIHAQRKYGFDAMPTLLAFDSVLVTCGMNSAIPNCKKRMIELLPEMQRCCEAVLEDLGETHPNMLVIYGNVANAWGITGDLDQCVKIRLRLLSLAEKEFGRKSVIAQGQIWGLAAVYNELGDDGKVGNLLEEFIAARESGVPLDDQKVELARKQLKEAALDSSADQ